MVVVVNKKNKLNNFIQLKLGFDVKQNIIIKFQSQKGEEKIETN